MHRKTEQAGDGWITRNLTLAGLATPAQEVYSSLKHLAGKSQGQIVLHRPVETAGFLMRLIGELTSRPVPALSAGSALVQIVTFGIRRALLGSAWRSPESRPPRAPRS